MKYNILVFELSIFFMVFLGSIGYFFIGFHNVDLGMNVHWINGAYHLNLFERVGDMDPIDLYIKGINQMMLSFIAFGLSSLCWPLMAIEARKLNKKWRFDIDE